MKLSDQRLEEIRAWLCGESKRDACASPQEMAAMATELKQLRLRTSSSSRSELAAPSSGGH
jgi:hypothetical protein